MEICEKISTQSFNILYIWHENNEVRLFVLYIYIYIHQGCIKLIKNDSKDM